MKPLEELKNIQHDHKDIEIIRNLYWNHKATVLINDLKSGEISIQGTIALFNLFSQVIFQRRRNEEVKIESDKIHFTDDTVRVFRGIALAGGSLPYTEGKPIE